MTSKKEAAMSKGGFSYLKFLLVVAIIVIIAALSFLATIGIVGSLMSSK